MTKVLNRDVFELPFSRLMSNPDYANASFYSFIIAKMAVKITKDVPTAGVAWAERKYNLFINPDFFETLDTDERIGVLIHEALHVMLKHNFRQGERDQKLFNIAADIALNQLIHKPAKLPEGAMLPETFEFKKGLTAEGYYELLKEEKDNQEQEKQEQEDKGEEWGGPSDGKPDLTGDEEMTLDSHEGWGQAGDSAEEELARATMEKMIKDAMDKSRGNLPGNISELLDLWTKKAKISWKRILKKIVSSKKGSKIQTIKRRDRRQPQRKDIKGKKVFYDQPNVIVGVDVSGSMSDEEIFNGLSEIAEVCKVTHSNLKVVQIDTNIQGTEEFDPKQKTWTREGCGGTYMGEMAKYLNEKKIQHDCLIMISDMFIEDVTSDANWLKHKKPVLWLNTSGTDFDGLKHHKVFNISDA
jgi:predicted metal-dependent peptidase